MSNSMAIVANRSGKLLEAPKGIYQDQIKALSWKGVKRIVEKFSALNPYDHSKTSDSILGIEDANFDEGEQQREIHA
jgi:hypothetical protein